MNNPKVSVVTPVFNGVETIEDCIQSVKDQNYPNIEHIIVDGESSDGTQAILDNLLVKYVSEPDAGIYDAFSKGVRRATGSFIHILNADDYYDNPNAIKNMVMYMMDEKIDICHALVQLVDEDKKPVRVIGKNINKTNLLKKMRVAHPSVFVRHDVYRKFGLFSVGFRAAGDQEFLLRVWDKVNVGFRPEVVVSMRLGGISDNQVLRSCRESMAAAVIHGRSPTKALLRYYFECIKNIHRIIRSL